ncbi:MAG: hypothetical protein U0359_09350 [Byssovorax sp.]
MQIQAKTELVGFVELKVGSLNVQVPIRSAKEEGPDSAALPLATFEAEGSSGVIVIHGDQGARGLENAVNEAAKKAMVHLSRKLLN